MKKQFNLILFTMLFFMTGTVFAKNSITFSVNDRGGETEVTVKYYTNKGESGRLKFKRWNSYLSSFDDQTIEVNGEVTTVEVSSERTDGTFKRTKRKGAESRPMCLFSGKVNIKSSGGYRYSATYIKKSNGRTYKLVK